MNGRSGRAHSRAGFKNPKSQRSAGDEERHTAGCERQVTGTPLTLRRLQPKNGKTNTRLTRRSNTRRRSNRPMESTDNNPARSKYYISPRASESHYWRSKHRRSRQAELQKSRRRPAKRSL
jgi:hypothetical protein